MAKAKYSKEEFYNEIKRIYGIENKINKTLYYKHTKLDVDYVYYINKFGGIKSICNEIGIDYLYYNQPSEESIIESVIKLKNKYGYINKDICCKNNISSSTVRRVFGGYNNLFEKLNYDLNMPRFVTLDEVLKDIETFYDKYSTVSSTKYRKLGTYSCTIINKYGGWRNLLDILNIKPLYRNYGYDYIISKVKKVYDEYGFITAELINDNCEFSYQSFRSYFKSKKDASSALGCDDAFKRDGSQHEVLIDKILKESIGKDGYIREMTWKWLKNDKSGYNLYCDFYIPSLNLVIEYNGRQHYEFVKRFHITEDGFLNQIYRDKLKKDLLKDNNIKLATIKYNETITPEFIENILK